MARSRMTVPGSPEEELRWTRYSLAFLPYSRQLDRELHAPTHPWGRYELNATLFAVVLGIWPERCCDPAELDTGRFDEIIAAKELATGRYRDSFVQEADRRFTIRRLLAAGANPRAFDSAVLRLAAAGGLADTVELLMQKGADPGAKDCEAFVLAAGNGFVAAARRLRAAHPVPRRRLGDALLRACELSETSHVIQWLLELGADASVDDSMALRLIMDRRNSYRFGERAEDFRMDTSGLVRDLIRCGADPSILVDTDDLRWVAGLVGVEHPSWPKLAAAIMRQLL